MYKEKLKNVIFYLMGFGSLVKVNKRPPQFINIVGDLFSESGLGSITRQIIASIDGRFEYQLIDLPLSAQSRQQKSRELRRLGTSLKPGITIFVGNPEILLKAFIKLNAWRVIQNYNVGVWFWELGKLPRPWQHIAPLMNEVWTQSTFVKAAFQGHCSQVKVMPFSLDAVVPSGRQRSDFGLPKNKFIYLFTFDYLSHAARKNPWSVIEAFIDAFGDSADVLLVIKTVNAKFVPRVVKNLRSMAVGFENIIFIDEYFLYQDVLRLIELSDCYVSLHRSEGLGLGLAEAMRLGTLTMATNYSGNTDFMNCSNALMVDCTPVPVVGSDYPYSQGSTWAEPNKADTIALMRYAFFERVRCQHLIERAKVSVAKYTTQNQGNWIKEQILEIV